MQERSRTIKFATEAAMAAGFCSPSDLRSDDIMFDDISLSKLPACQQVTVLRPPVQHQPR